MGEAKRRKNAATKHTQPIIVTSDAWARFANSQLAGLVHNFAICDIRSASISTVWCDDEVGGSYHVEGDDKAKTFEQLEKVLTILRGEVETPPLMLEERAHLDAPVDLWVL